MRKDNFIFVLLYVYVSSQILIPSETVYIGSWYDHCASGDHLTCMVFSFS